MQIVQCWVTSSGAAPAVACFTGDILPKHVDTVSPTRNAASDTTKPNRKRAAASVSRQPAVPLPFTSG